MFAQVAVGVAVCRYGHADARDDQAMRLASRVFCHHGKDHFARMEKRQPFLAGDELGARRKDRRNPDEVLRRDTGIA